MEHQVEELFIDGQNNTLNDYMKVIKRKVNHHSLTYIIELSKYEIRQNGGKKFAVVKESFENDTHRIKKLFVKTIREANHLYERMKKAR